MFSHRSLRGRARFVQEGSPRRLRTLSNVFEPQGLIPRDLAGGRTPRRDLRLGSGPGRPLGGAGVARPMLTCSSPHYAPPLLRSDFGARSASADFVDVLNVFLHLHSYIELVRLVNLFTEDISFREVPRSLVTGSFKPFLLDVYDACRY